MTVRVGLMAIISQIVNICGTVVRLVILSVHFPGGGTVGHCEDAVVWKMCITYESWLTGDPAKQHAG